MAKVKYNAYIDADGVHHHPQYLYWCVGCGHEHAFALKSQGGHHTFNGDLINPTVSPSLVSNFSPGTMCHSFIRNGMIQYLNDCHHHLKGATIELPDIEEKLNSNKANAGS
jgi:hypothetical protein